MNQDNSKKKWLGRGALLMASILWGSAYMVMKGAVNEVPPLVLLFYRFLSAFLLMMLIFRKRIFHMSRRNTILAWGAGACLIVGCIFQVTGLATVDPGKTGILTATYGIMVPFLYWIFYKVKPDIYNILTAIMCLAGVGIISLKGNWTFEKGDILVLFGCVFFAGQIVLLSQFDEKDDPIAFIILQLLPGVILSGLLSLLIEGPSSLVRIPSQAWFAILYSGIFAMGATLTLQNYGQNNLPPSQAALLMSLESFFAVVFSVIFYGEKLTVRLVAGFLLIFTALVISETKLDFLKKNGRIINV